MGVGVYLYLIDKDKYISEIVPAFDVFYQNKDTSKLLILIEEVLSYAEFNPDGEIYKEMYLLGRHLLLNEDISSKEQKDFVKNLESLFAIDFCREKEFKVINFAKTFLSEHLLSESEILASLVGGYFRNFKRRSYKYFGESGQVFSEKDSKLLLKELNSISFPINIDLIEDFNSLKNLVKKSCQDRNLKLLYIVE